MSIRLRTLLLALTILVILPAPASQAQGERLNLIASNSILADVMAQVAGEAADVTSLMPLFADPHSFTPAPRDLVALADADAIFLVGATFEEGLLGSIENAGQDLNLLVASECVDILPFGAAVTDVPHNTPDEGEVATLCAGHYEELTALGMDAAVLPALAIEDGMAPLGPLHTLDCDQGHAAEGDEHEAGTCDPHVWTDPHNVMLWTLMIRDRLSELDPANADVYAANADAYLHALDALIQDELAPLIASIPAANRKLVTNHQAFGYYAHAFGLELIGTVIPGGSTLAEPSAATMAALVDAIRAAKVTAVFSETTANAVLAEQIARETGASFYALYTGSLSEPDGPAATYLDYMRYNTQLIAEALAD